MIKASNGCHGAYSPIFEIQPWMKNPFNPRCKIFWMICLFHQVSTVCHIKCNFICLFVLQLKNMINALFSSKDEGTKQFQCGKESVLFGWKFIMDLYKRKLGRVSNGWAQLREAHCLRDSWTKLNVCYFNPLTCRFFLK